MNRLIEFENEKRIDELIREIVDLKLKKDSPENKIKIQNIIFKKIMFLKMYIIQKTYK